MTSERPEPPEGMVLYENAGEWTVATEGGWVAGVFPSREDAIAAARNPDLERFWLMGRDTAAKTINTLHAELAALRAERDALREERSDAYLTLSNHLAWAVAMSPGEDPPGGGLMRAARAIADEYEALRQKRAKGNALADAVEELRLASDDMDTERWNAAVAAVDAALADWRAK